MALYKYLAQKGRSVPPMVGDTLSRNEVERANERVKQVLRDANQDKKLAIQFLPDRGVSKCS